MADAPERLRLFQQVDGKRNTAELARAVKRHINNTRRDLNLLRDAGLIQPVMRKGEELRTSGHPVYEKVPLARTIPHRLFSATPSAPLRTSSRQATPKADHGRGHRSMPGPLAYPTENEILDIARLGEDQTHEFKRQGTEARGITREIAAMLNTREGGMILYGIDDAGSIEGSDVSSQRLDQPLQNAIRNTISPAATVKMRSINVLGTPVIVIIVPPWNRRQVYHYEGRVLLRRGTNVFVAKPEESKQLHAGKYIT
jgi:hypothetical protein